MKRSLSLKRENLTTLTAAELHSVAGAEHTIPSPGCVTEILRDNVTQYLDFPALTEKCA